MEAIRRESLVEMTDILLFDILQELKQLNGKGGNDERKSDSIGESGSDNTNCIDGHSSNNNKPGNKGKRK